MNQCELGPLIFSTRYISIFHSQSSPTVFSTAFTAGTEAVLCHHMRASPDSCTECSRAQQLYLVQYRLTVSTFPKSLATSKVRKERGRGEPQDNPTGWYFIFSSNKQGIHSVCTIGTSLSNRFGTSAPLRRERMQSAEDGGYTFE